MPSLLMLARNFALSVLVLNLVACGGGGGGGSDNAPAPPQQPTQPIQPTEPTEPTVPNQPADEPNVFFPTSAVLRWNYHSSTSQTTVSLQFSADRVVDGLHVHDLSYPTGGKEYFITSAAQVKLKGMFLPQIFVDGAPFSADINFSEPLAIWDTGWAAGQSKALSGGGTVVISPTYGTRSISYAGVAQFVGDEFIRTPAGTFSRAKHFNVNLSLTTTVDDVVFNVPYSVGFWLSENTGIVKRSQGGVDFNLSGMVGPDRDNDGVPDGIDPFPDNSAESRDFDGDRIGDIVDMDDDNDGVADNVDAFPLDASEWLDTDGDQIGNNVDDDDDGDSVLDTWDAFPLNSQRSVVMTVTSTPLAFAGVFGSSQAPATQSIQLSGAHARWSATPSAGWIHLGSTQGNDAGSVSVAIDSDALDLGASSGSITFTDLDSGAQTTVQVGVNLVLPVLSSNIDSVSFDASLGWASITAQQIQFSTNTGSNGYVLNAVMSPPGVSGVNVDIPAAQISGSGLPVTIGLSPANVKGGSHTANIVFSTSIRGRTISKTIAVGVLASEHILYSSSRGIAFSQLPGFQQLQTILKVNDSYGAMTPWQATSNQTWLSVTSSGVAGGNLQVVANPAGLATNTLHTAEISISSSNASIENVERVRVGLWIGSTNPPASSAVTHTYRYIARDPVRPYIYVNNNDSSPIDVYNIYTRALVGSISNVSVYALNDMAVSGDGRYLFVRATQSYFSQPEVVRIDLENFQNRVTFPIIGSGLAIARPLGHEVLISDSSADLSVAAFDPISGAALGGSLARVSFSMLRGSEDGQSFCYLTLGQTPADAGCYRLLFSSVATSKAQSINGGAVPFSAIEGGGFLGVNFDATKIYTSNYGGGILSFDTSSATYTQVASISQPSTYASNVEVLRNGSFLTGVLVSGNSSQLVHYSSSNVAGSTLDISAFGAFQRTRSMVIANDELMGAVLTYAQDGTGYVVFFRVP